MVYCDRDIFHMALFYLVAKPAKIAASKYY